MFVAKQMYVIVPSIEDSSTVPFIHLNLNPWIRIFEKPEGPDVVNESSLPYTQQLTTEIPPDPCGTKSNLPKLFLHNPL